MKNFISNISYYIGPKTFSIVVTILMAILAIILIKRVIGKIFILFVIIGIVCILNTTNIKNVNDLKIYLDKHFNIENVDEEILDIIENNKDIFNQVKRYLLKYDNLKIENNNLIFYNKNGDTKIISLY